MKISPGKIITLRKNGTKFPESYQYDLTLSTELTINLKSDFEPLLSSSTPAATFFTLISQTARHFGSKASFTGQFKEMGYKIWKGTSPILFSFETMLTMRTSGKKDVLDPAKELMNICLPTQGAFEDKQIGLVAPGPSIFTAAEGKLGNNSTTGVKFSIAIGSFYLPNIIIESVEPTFSSEVDSEGYPVWCQLKLDVSSISTATTDLIDNFGSAQAMAKKE